MSERSVIKLGGELLDPAHTAELAAIAADAKLLLDRGHQLVLVHGGGPQSTALQKALGQEPRIVLGRRVTDQETLEVIKMVVAGRLNIDFCSALRAAGVNALGLHGVSGGLIRCERRPPKVMAGAGDQPIDFGFVGDVTAVNEALLALLLERGYTPVLACVGGDASGRAYNINADVVASGVAVGIGARRLLLVTGTPGVLREVKDPSSRLARLTSAEAAEAIKSGVVQGGMIPKLEESLEALSRGVQEVQIVGRLAPGDLLRALEHPGSVGTAVVR